MLRTPVFDFDGTLADTEEIYFQIFNELAHEYGLAKITREEADRLRHLTILEKFRYFHVPIRKMPSMIKASAPYYADKIDQAKPYPGIKELLYELDRKKIRKVIVSSNKKDNIMRFLQNHELNVFDTIIGGASIFGKHRTIKRIMRAIGEKPDRILYIGDELRDIEACKKLSVKMIAVSWGFDKLELLQKGEPDHIVHEPHEIADLLFSSNEPSQEKKRGGT